MDDEKATELNRISWDRRARLHLNAPYYRDSIEKLRAGGHTLRPPTDTEIGDISGKRLVHIQCHIGLDSFSLARMGASVTGLDFSSEAVEVATELAADLGIEADFVVGNSMQATDVLGRGGFDIAFSSYGVFCWIADIYKWMASAAELLRPGGVLYIADGHPFMEIFEDAPEKPYGVELHYSYFRRKPLEFGPAPSYADDGSNTPVPRTVEFIHPLSDIINAAIAAGLRIDFVHEFPAMFFQRHKTMTEYSFEQWDFDEPLRGKLPMVFSMRATKA